MLFHLLFFLYPYLGLLPAFLGRAKTTQKWPTTDPTTQTPSPGTPRLLLPNSSRFVNDVFANQATTQVCRAQRSMSNSCDENDQRRLITSPNQQNPAQAPAPQSRPPPQQQYRPQPPPPQQHRPQPPPQQNYQQQQPPQQQRYNQNPPPPLPKDQYARPQDQYARTQDQYARPSPTHPQSQNQRQPTNYGHSPPAHTTTHRPPPPSADNRPAPTSIPPPSPAPGADSGSDQSLLPLFRAVDKAGTFALLPHLPVRHESLY